MAIPSVEFTIPVTVVVLPAPRFRASSIVSEVPVAAITLEIPKLRKTYPIPYFT